MPASDPYIENEVKIPFPDGPDAARKTIEGAGFHLKAARTLESDQLFDRDGELRRAGDRATVTYKGPGRRERHKTREEVEFDVSDPSNFARVLELLGYTPGFRYEKYRTKFEAPGEPGEVTIDETPIGVFLELEGPPDWIDKTASRLDLRQAEYLTQSYASLYKEYRRTHQTAPADMTFG